MSSKSHEMDLCSGSLWKKIFVYSVPLMFTNILQVLFNMSDVAVVGKFAGAIALGAVGSTSILVTLFNYLSGRWYFNNCIWHSFFSQYSCFNEYKG